MQTKKTKVFIIVFILLIITIPLALKSRNKKPYEEAVKEITPQQGAIQNVISTTGMVLPKNRLEIKPPVNGRVESILVKEGQTVKVGEALAWMSSTERAALLDAARGKGEDTLKYWEQAYKPIALIAPIDAEVIVATTQPGQTVTTSDAVVVLSDKLIVRAQVDETDIGKVKLTQKASVSLDAYPQTKIDATVEHIYYESKTVNNVTIYEVDLIPLEAPSFFRSGMNATINFIEKSKDNIMLLPLEAVLKEKEGNFVLVKEKALEPVKRLVKTGISDDKNIEIISGIGMNDKVIIKSKKYALPKTNAATNPLMPFGRRRDSKR